MVIDHVGVVKIRLTRRVEPPDFVPLLVGAANNLIGLRHVEVLEDVVTQGAGQRLDATGVGVELILAHPVGDVGRCCHRARGHNRDVVGVFLQAKHVGRAEELEGVEVAIRPDEDFLTDWHSAHDARAARYPDITCRIRRGWRPVTRRVLVSPADKHGVEVVDVG